MAILSSNFSSNTLSGTVTVYNGIANINVGVVNPFYLDGQKSFVVKLRKNSVDGAVVGSSNPILIPDRSRIVSVTANVASVNEGDLVQYTITTANVAQNTTLYYDTANVVGNVNFSDFNSGNTGTVLIQNNSGTFTVRALADLSLTDEEGESFKINFRATSAAGNVVYTTANVITIVDTSKIFTVNSVTSNILIGSDADIIRFDVSTYNAVNTPVYYSITGSLLSSEMYNSTTGSFTPTTTSNITSLTFRMAGNVAVEPRNFKLQIRENSVSGNIKFTSANVFIFGSPVVATGGTTAVTAPGEYKIHAFTSPGTLTISSTSFTNSNVDYMIVGGGAGGGSVNAGYVATNAGGGGGIIQGNIRVFSGNTFSVVIGAGGARGEKGSGYTLSPAGSGTPTTMSNPGFTWTALGGGQSHSGSSAFGTGGGNGPGMNASGSPTIGARGTQGYPGGYGGGGGGAGGSGDWNSPLNGAGGPGVPYDASDAYGTPGPTPGRWFGGGGGDRKFWSETQLFANVAGGVGGGGPSTIGGSPFYNTPGANGQGQEGNVNTGGGGGSGAYAGPVNSGEPGGAGGSGIVIIKYKIANGTFAYTP
jgi:hypothetical protein